MNKTSTPIKIAILILAMVAFYLASSITSDLALEEHQKLESIWAQDLQNLSAQPGLDKIINGLKRFDVEPAGSDSLASSWLQKMKIPLKTHLDGIYRADILVISDTDNQARAATVQMTFMDLKSGNVVAELARRYELK